MRDVLHELNVSCVANKKQNQKFREMSQICKTAMFKKKEKKEKDRKIPLWKHSDVFPKCCRHPITSMNAYVSAGWCGENFYLCCIVFEKD